MKRSGRGRWTVLLTVALVLAGCGASGETAEPIFGTVDTTDETVRLLNED